MRKLATTAILCLLASTASAEQCKTETPEQKKARTLYEEGIASTVKGDYGAARKKYERLIAEHPNSPLVCWARDKLAGLTAGKLPINRNGRAAFIIGATLFSAWSANAIALLVSLDDENISEGEGKAMIWASIGGAAAGLVPSIIFSSNLRMSTGRATMINFGWMWGLWHGLAFSLMPDELNGRASIGAALGGSVAGWIGTFALTHYVDVADGDAALIATSAGWASYLTITCAALIAGENVFDSRVALLSALLAGGDAGLVGGALLSRKIDISAGRVGLINLGGLLGGMLGGGILALTIEEFDSPRAPAAIMLGTMAGGLVLTAFLTRNYDEPGPQTKGLAVLERTPSGWAFGLPPPQISLTPERGLAAAIPLVGGEL